MGLSTEEFIFDDSRLHEMQQEICKLSQLNQNSQHKKNILQRKIHRTTFMQHIHDKNGQNPFVVFKFDFSVISSSENTNEDGFIEPHFEIELEYVGNKQHGFISDVCNSVEQIAKLFGTNIETMLKLIHKSPVVMTWNEHNSVLSAYNTMLNIPNQYNSDTRILFRGAQPETLHYRNLESIAKKSYFVADKSDGERAHMLCSKDGNVYFISRFLHVIKTNIKCPKLSVSILDVELFLGEQNKILTFDILVQNGQDVRNKNTSDRISILKSIDMSNVIENIDTVTNWKMIMKKMHFSKANSFPKKEITNILNNVSMEYKTDGLVFTPADEPHPFNRKWTSLLKWKPPNLNSIDLYVEKGLDNGKKGYFLYANSSQIVDRKTGHLGILLNENQDNIQVQFPDNSTNFFPKDQVEILRKKPTKKVLFCPYPFVKEGDVFDSLMPDKHIVEFIFNLETFKLEPIRVRYDKTAIGVQGSNYLRIALDTWSTMICPILKEHLMRFNLTNKKHSKNENENGALSRSFMFHNIMKENLIKLCTEYVKLPYFREMKSLPSTFDPSRKAWTVPAIPELIDIMNNGKYKHIHSFLDEKTDEIIVPIYSNDDSEGSNNVNTKLIDLCSGKGGDLWKWIRSNINFVFGIDNESLLLMDQEDAAIKRWKYIKGNNDSNLSVIFAEMDARAKVSDYLLSKQLLYEFDIASCFFAMHYFFGSQTDFNKFITNVDEILSFGGYYIGTVMNGEKLYDLLKSGNGLYEIKGEGNGKKEKEKVLCRIQQKFSKKNVSIHSRDTFGLEIEVDIADSILNDYLPTRLEKLNKKEYLVDLNKLRPKV